MSGQSFNIIGIAYELTIARELKDGNSRGVCSNIISATNARSQRSEQICWLEYEGRQLFRLDIWLNDLSRSFISAVLYSAAFLRL